jgi:Flp pilus assembly protein TadD
LLFALCFSSMIENRTSLNPQDAQAWRRLSSVFGRLGDFEKAEVAHFTAWQLGIGQGAFGGPK